MQRMQMWLSDYVNRYTPIFVMVCLAFAKPLIDDIVNDLIIRCNQSL